MMRLPKELLRSRLSDGGNSGVHCMTKAEERYCIQTSWSLRNCSSSSECLGGEAYAAMVLWLWIAWLRVVHSTLQVSCTIRDTGIALFGRAFNLDQLPTPSLLYEIA